MIKLSNTLFDIVERDKAEATILITPLGQILHCNLKAQKLFGYESVSDFVNQCMGSFFPDDFAQLLPAYLTGENLTKGEYKELINKTSNGVLIPTFVNTYQITSKGKNYIIAKYKLNSELLRMSESELHKRCLMQNISILKTELNKERNLRKKTGIEISSNLDNLGIPKLDFELNSKLAGCFPKLTNNDFRLCSLLILNKTSREIAEEIGISIDAVFTARKRLRKKLNLQTSDNLVSFLNRFDND